MVRPKSVSAVSSSVVCIPGTGVSCISDLPVSLFIWFFTCSNKVLSLSTIHVYFALLPFSDPSTTPPHSRLKSTPQSTVNYVLNPLSSVFLTPSRKTRLFHHYILKCLLTYLLYLLTRRTHLTYVRVPPKGTSFEVREPIGGGVRYYRGRDGQVNGRVSDTVRRDLGSFRGSIRDESWKGVVQETHEGAETDSPRKSRKSRVEFTVGNVPGDEQVQVRRVL